MTTTLRPIDARTASNGRMSSRKDPGTSVRRPRRRPVDMAHYPGLDGLRGLAVLAVLVYHAGLSWATGGFLGVELFFVLSGFLITSLLLAEWRRTDGIALAAFWGRRARRLLPALFALVAVIGVYYAIAGPTHTIPGLRADGLAAFFYFGNWHQIAAGSSYFATTGPVSPFQHTWSLAIEEQFYVFWPLLVLGLLRFASRRAKSESARVRSLRMLLLLCIVGAFLSALEMLILFRGGPGLNRVYYGTDTRAFSLLIGAALAIGRALHIWVPRKQLDPRLQKPQRRRQLELVSSVALALLLVAMFTADGTAAWLFPFGFVGVDLCAVAVILTIVTRPWAPVSQILSWKPMRQLGAISYGLYLWHFPLFQWLDASTTGVSGAPLFILRVLVALAVSIVSYVVIEQPIRRRRMPTVLVRGLTPFAAAGAVALLLLGASLSQINFSDAAAKTLPPPPASAAGNEGPCQVSLTDTPNQGIAPLPLSTAQQTEYGQLGKGKLTWPTGGHSTLTFKTCPPNKVLMVGDSLSYTLGVGFQQQEQRYGLEIDNAAILGCAFNNRGQLQVSGVFQAQSDGCNNALDTWSREADQLGAKAVIVELGYRDQFDWKVGGKIEHLGQPEFDAYVQAQIARYIRVLGENGRRKVLFLSIPWSKPPANPDGSASVAGTPARHQMINAMLKKAATGHGNVGIINLDTVISPQDKYTGNINGKLCRFDGIHFTLYCSGLLQPSVLADLRNMIGA